MGGATSLYVAQVAGVRKMDLEAAVWTSGKQKYLGFRHEISIKDFLKGWKISEFWTTEMPESLRYNGEGILPSFIYRMLSPCPLFGGHLDESSP